MPASRSQSPLEPEDANTQLRLLTHKIRIADASLALAQRRRRLSNVTLVFGPFLLVVLFELYWVLRGHDTLMEAIYIPGGLLAILAAAATAKLKFTPGGTPIEGSEKLIRPRQKERDIELDLSELRDERKVIAGHAGMNIEVRRVAYRDDAYADVRNLREEASRYRRVNNALQAVLIVGSLAATGAAAIIGQIPQVRWVTLGITFVVGISSGFMGYFKYKERSFYLQQTADAIETEWEAVEVGCGSPEVTLDLVCLEFIGLARCRPSGTAWEG